MYPTPAPHLSDEVKKTTLADNVKVPIRVTQHHETPVANDLMRTETVPSLASIQQEASLPQRISSGFTAQSVPESVLLKRDASVGSDMGHSAAASNSSPPSWLLRSGGSKGGDTSDPFGDTSSQARLLDAMARVPPVVAPPALAATTDTEKPLERLVYVMSNDGVPMVRNPDSKYLVQEHGKTGKKVKKDYDTRRRALAARGRLDLIL